jgi:hypothetical protein
MATRSARFSRRPVTLLARMGCITLACLSACAGSKQSAAPAARQPVQAAAPERATDDAAERKPGYGYGQDAASAAGASAGEMTNPRTEAAQPRAAAPAPPIAEAPGAADPHSPAGRARVRLSEARRELEIAMSERDCARVCRALESMERAAQQVCELARSPEERSECASATQQVDKARGKVQSACGECPRKSR